MATFYDRFNQLYIESEMAQEEFGNLFGATKSQIFNWRNRRGEPDTETLKAIALSRQVSVDWLVGNSDLRAPLSDIERLKAEIAYKLTIEFQDYIQQKYPGR